MPLSSDSSRVCWVSLAIDRELPEESRPAFAARFLTIAQRDQLLEDIAAGGNRSRKEENRSLAELLGRAFAGWRNLRDPESGEVIEFAGDFLALNRVLVPEERGELLGLALYGTRFRARKKASSSASSSAGA